MADGTLIFATKLLAEGFEAGIKKVNEGLGGLKGKLTSLSKTIGTVFGVNWFAYAINGAVKFYSKFRPIAEECKSLWNVQLEAKHASGRY